MIVLFLFPKKNTYTQETKTKSKERVRRYVNPKSIPHAMSTENVKRANNNNRSRSIIFPRELAFFWNNMSS